MSTAGEARAVHLVRALRHGGIETLLLSVLPLLGRAGWPCRVLRIGPEESPLDESFRRAGIRVDRLLVPSRWSPPGILRLRSWLRRRRPGILHTHGYAQNVTGTVAGRLAGVPAVVAHVHGFLDWEGSRRRRAIERALTGWRARVIACSESVGRELLAAGLPASRVVVLPNAVDLERFRPSPRAAGGGEPVIGVVASLRPEKGHRLLLAALSRLDREGVGFRCLVVGEGEDRRALEAEVRRLRLEGRVEFLGYREDVPAVLARLDVAVLPADSEGFGIAALEAQACGVPVVATSVGGLAERILDGETGLLIPPGDPEALAGALRRLLGDATLRRDLATRALRSVRVHGLDRYVERLAELYEEIRASPRAP